MGQPVARQTDTVAGTDVHVLLVPSPGGPVPTPTPLPFSGKIMSNTSPNVYVNGLPVATIGSVAQNLPPHLPPPSTSFSVPPTNTGVVLRGSVTVLVNGKGIARVGDQVNTCNDPVPAPTSTIATGSTNVIAS